MLFATFATAGAIVALLVGLAYLLATNFMLKEWALESTSSTRYTMRRTGAIYLGMSPMLMLARVAPPSDLRAAVCAGAALAMAATVVLSLIELKHGRISPRVLGSVVVESIFAVGFAGLATG